MLDMQMAQQVVKMAKPTIFGLFESREAVWGPKFIVVAIQGPDMEEPYIEYIGQLTLINQGTPEEFQDIALWKMETALEYGMSTSELAYLHPGALREEDFFYPGGIVDKTGTVAIGASGIKGWADEAVAKIILALIEMLCLLRKDDLVKSGRSQLPAVNPGYACPEETK